MNAIPTNRGAMTIGEIIADLTYINYACNRDAAPHVTPTSWKRVYGSDVDTMEARYQTEKIIIKARSAE